MLSMKRTKNGGIAIVFQKGQEDIALKTYTLVASNLFSIEPESIALNKTEKKLSDIKLSIEEKRVVCKVENFKKFPLLSLRRHFNNVMWQITELRGLKAFSQRDLNNLYNRLLRESGGFDPRVVGKQELHVEDEDIAYNKTYINTCFNKGYGPLLTKIAEDLLEQLGGLVA
ncbi:hypothetical protein [Cytobacillus massiliigabonensis]|uniref:hypothetical protein n=1 Tax=Cytobacillus massiliigabonensis TaxID=1871011 RepID=UPI000C83DD18|nr:hypothetical protein [Cytobacillus massiliigabonensis]